MDKVKQTIDKMIVTGANVGENLYAMYNLNLLTIEQYEELINYYESMIKYVR